jgi:hypothetical protein
VSSEGAGDGETKRLQEAAVPPANYVHPEFGYLCPTSRLRRDFRVAVVAIVLGGIIGAIVVTLRANHDRDAETERIRIDAVKADAAERVTDGAKSGGAKSDSAKSDSAKSDSAKTDSAKTGGAKADAAKPPCEDNTWADLDGNCATSKPRRVKVRAATDSPAIGAAPLGRTVSTGVATSAPAATNAPAAPQSSPPSAAPSNATASPAASQPSAAATKKAQKVARSQSRTGNDRSVRDERANGRGYAGYANAPGGYHQGANQGFFGWFW